MYAKKRKTYSYLWSFSEVWRLMVRESSYTKIISHLKEKKQCRLPFSSSLSADDLRSSAFVFKVWIYFYVKYWSLFKGSEIIFFSLCWLRNTCKPIRVDLHWVPRSLECLSVILVKKLSLSQVSWRDTVASTQVTPEIVFILRGFFSNVWVLCLESLLMLSANCI